MMDELFNEEYLREQYDKHMFAEGKAEGKAEGRAEGRAETTKIIADKMRKMGLSEDQIRMATGM